MIESEIVFEIETVLSYAERKKKTETETERQREGGRLCVDMKEMFLIISGI